MQIAKALAHTQRAAEQRVSQAQTQLQLMQQMFGACGGNMPAAQTGSTQLQAPAADDDHMDFDISGTALGPQARGFGQQLRLQSPAVSPSQNQLAPTGARVQRGSHGRTYPSYAPANLMNALQYQQPPAAAAGANAELQAILAQWALQQLQGQGPMQQQ